MTVSQPALCLIALLMAGGTCIEAVRQAQPDIGLSREQFHANCTAQEGRFGMLRNEVICSLSEKLALVCQYETSLGNCLWSGPMDPASLGRMFAVTRDAPGKDAAA